jgi:hypothetical protein
MVRTKLLVLPLAALASGCAILPDSWTPSWLPFSGKSSPSDEGLRAFIADDVMLELPTPPGYPEERTIVQTGRAQFGERNAAFEAVLQLGPERTEIVLMMPAGPRLSTIVWDATGVHEDRAPFVPDGMPVENILADIFVTVWPEDMVAGTLPEGVTLEVGADGARTIRRGDEIILTIGPDPADPSRFVVRNEALGYEVAMVRQVDETAAVAVAEAPAEIAPPIEAVVDAVAQPAPEAAPAASSPPAETVPVVGQPASVSTIAANEVAQSGQQ